MAEDSLTIAESYAGIAEIQYGDKDYVQASDSYQQAHDLFTQVGETERQAESAVRLARIYGHIAEYKSALDLQIEALDIYEGNGNHEETGLNSKRTAWYYERLGDLDDSVAQYEHAAKAYGKIEDFYEMARCYQQVGAIRQNQQKWELSQEGFEKALEYARKTEDDFLITALEDSVEDMKGRNKKKPKADSGDTDSGRRGFLGKLFGK